MSATGLILDAVLMLLLVAALGFGIRLERKLTALRAGQAAFAGAVTELNSAAARAEAALGSLRAASQETDLLHDRIVKARAVKAELETLIAKGPRAPLPPLHGEGRSRSDQGGEVSDRTHALSDPTLADAAHQPSLPIKGRENDGDAATRIAALKARLEPAKAAAAPATAPRERTIQPVTSLADAIRAMTEARGANHASKPAVNRPRRTLDEDLFAA